MTRQFTCAACGNPFYTDTTPEERSAEFQVLYGHTEEDSDEGLVAVCDTCYEIVLKEKK